MSDVKAAKGDPIIDVMEECRVDASACMLSDLDPEASVEDKDAIAEYVDQYRETLDGLATLDLDLFTLDSRDLEALTERKNADVLADLIARDPAYEVLKQRRTALEFEATRLDPVGHSPGIPSAHYKRLVYLLQAGLAQLVDPTLTPNGRFGPQTRDALADFQANRGIDRLNGELVDQGTVDALVCELRFDLAGIRQRLTDAQELFMNDEVQPFFINGPDDSDVEGRNFVRAALEDAMIWVGALSGRVNLSSPRGKEALQAAIEDYIGKTVDLVGERAIADILNAIDLENPVVERIR